MLCSDYVSPMKKADGSEQYLTFEPDSGGWNNIRMAMETVLAMAAAMGRTLVLPPEAGMYLLGKQKHEKSGTAQQNTFSFNDFFPMEKIHNEFHGLNIISMHEYLTKVAMTGQMISIESGKVSFPPHNRTQWDGRSDISELNQWLRKVSYMKIVTPEDCLLVFPTSHESSNIEELKTIENTILQQRPKFDQYVDKPVPIDGTPMDRLKENWADRKQLCIYDTEMQESTHLHFPVDHHLNARLLVHFYAFVFFQNWKQDLWMKRYVVLQLLSMNRKIS
jgi:GDP-fucose protein O-fucosyltransferase